MVILTGGEADRGVTDAMETVRGDRLLRLSHGPGLLAVVVGDLGFVAFLGGGVDY